MMTMTKEQAIDDGVLVDEIYATAHLEEEQSPVLSEEFYDQEEPRLSVITHRSISYQQSQELHEELPVPRKIGSTLGSKRVTFAKNGHNNNRRATVESELTTSRTYAQQNSNLHSFDSDSVPSPGQKNRLSIDSDGLPRAWTKMSTRLSGINSSTIGQTRRVSAYSRGGGGGIQFHTSCVSASASASGQDPIGGSDSCTAGVSEDGGEVVEHEAITLPQSTHTLLFTENVMTLPFWFAIGILTVSVACLALALTDNLDGGTAENPLKVPANVSTSVRIAQYVSLIVAVLMEEEIPTALYLLRMIPRSSLENKLGLSYTKFVVSAMCRLAIGYMFLFNVLLVIIQSERVLDMFYDMLALNFVAMIDDISFKLAQLDILGKRLRNATTTPTFRTEFERKPYAFRKKMTRFTKFVFVFNFLVLFSSLVATGTRQDKGYFQCKNVSLRFGDEIWRNAWIRSTGQTRTLIYSYFNGIYRKTGRTHDGRPVYQELRKSEPEDFETIQGAEIRYCKEEQAWVFLHEDIMKTRTYNPESTCPWLLRSPKTDAFDLMDVSTNWEVWVGVISEASALSVSCNECQSSSHCNFNGRCVENVCECYTFDELNKSAYFGDESQPAFFGTHCESAAACQRIIADDNPRNNQTGDVWSTMLDMRCKNLKSYGRPIYTLEKTVYLDTGDTMNGTAIIPGAAINQVPFLGPTSDDKQALMYTGSRWVGVFKRGAANLTIPEIKARQADYHAFWRQAYKNDTIVISDPTTASSPVGVDFYQIGEEKGPQYGPLGVLYPMNSPPGKGWFRCLSDNRPPQGYEKCVFN